jgi:hypothetical protein
MATVPVQARAPSPVEFGKVTPPRVVCALFACSTCNWPLIGAKFTSSTAADFHETVFELSCDKCHWRGAVLGRDAVQHLIADWSARVILDTIEGA